MKPEGPPAPKPRIPLVALADLPVGVLCNCFALLAEKTRHATRDGKVFYSCRFRDCRREYPAIVWSDGRLFAECERGWQPGHFYKLRATLTETEKYGLQLTLGTVVPAEPGDEGFDPVQLVARSRSDPDELFAQLHGFLADAIADDLLRALTLTLLDRHAAALRSLPASPKHYFPFAGGWLEHTLSVCRNCKRLAEHYAAMYAELPRPIDLDLLLAGAALHEIGRVRELPGPFGSEPSVEGRLIGHVQLGRDIVRDAARELGLDDDRRLMLEHLILTYLSLPEWGSPRLPQVVECLILHHADDLDAKVEMFARCLSRDVSPGPFTDRDPVLGKSLYKGPIQQPDADSPPPTE